MVSLEGCCWRLTGAYPCGMACRLLPTTPMTDPLSTQLSPRAGPNRQTMGSSVEAVRSARRTHPILVLRTLTYSATNETSLFSDIQGPAKVSPHPCLRDGGVLVPACNCQPIHGMNAIDYDVPCELEPSPRVGNLSSTRRRLEPRVFQTLVHPACSRPKETTSRRRP